MTVVLAAGTFDMFHPGHESFLQQAAMQGTELHVIIARDTSVKKIKNLYPRQNEQERKQNVEQCSCVFRAYLGDEHDFLKIPKHIQPNIIAIGYDQHIPKNIAKEFPNATIMRMNAFHPEKYKSSLFRENNK